MNAEQSVAYIRNNLGCGITSSHDQNVGARHNSWAGMFQGCLDLINLCNASEPEVDMSFPLRLVRLGRIQKNRAIAALDFITELLSNTFLKPPTVVTLPLYFKSPRKHFPTDNILRLLSERSLKLQSVHIILT